MYIPDLKYLMLTRAVPGGWPKFRVVFRRLDDGALWYSVVDNDDFDWQFPVPLTDTAGATFKAEDTVVFFMRWIRQYIDLLKAAQAESQST